MNGFKIFKEDETLETFNNNAGVFKLIVQEPDLEVFESHVNKGKSIICQPYESENALNTILVLSGRLFHTNERQFVEPGQRIAFKNLQETHHISVLEHSSLIMIRQSRHFKNQVRNMDAVNQVMHQIQSKDLYTEDHCNNTGNLAVQIATVMKLSEDIIENILFGSKVHDVGKIHIPSEILNKPAALTTDEYTLVKKHCQDGYDIIMKEIGSEALAEIALDHHERLDGSGYPRGLKGDQISISSRILAVADSFDAMISERPYKRPIPIEAALEDLKAHIGTWYDPAVIKALCDIMTYTKEVYRVT